MRNQVDTSEETVAREWARIEEEHKVTPAEPEPQAEQPEFDPEPLEDQPEPMMDEGQKRLLTKAAIARTMKAATQMVGKVTLPEPVFDGLGDAYADLMLKYFPEMGVFGLLEKYKVEIAAVTATASFAIAYRTAKASQRESMKQQPAANDDNHEQEQTA
ncbi:hypothetical protein [Celerinatantimonas sp. MCCC 1A17872]|uniref:hypothetical protein n=1 Tax=Celerinatantimonas sp. MCCC 1A17872 TaxID=3177514 RepID=UPI0038C575BD